MKRSWAILACVAVLLCLGGCAHHHSPPRTVTYLIHYPDGEAWRVDVTVGPMIRVPPLDRPAEKKE